MTTPIFPSELPFVSGFKLTPTDQVLRSPSEDSKPISLHRFTRDPGATAQISWKLKGLQYKIFKTFWLEELLRGHRWFEVKIPSGGGYDYHTVRFTGPYSAKSEGRKYWDVSATIEILERKLTFLQEAFGSAFGQSTLVGSATQISSASGSAHGSSQVTGVGQSIKSASGISIGTSVAQASGAARVAATGAASGSSNSQGFSVAVVAGSGAAIGTSTASATSASTCPSYSTVTLQLTSSPYSAPSGDNAVLQQLPCPYTAPAVI
jgi:hypothetical protein